MFVTLLKYLIPLKSRWLLMSVRLPEWWRVCRNGMFFCYVNMRYLFSQYQNVNLRKKHFEIIIMLEDKWIQEGKNKGKGKEKEKEKGKEKRERKWKEKENSEGWSTWFGTSNIISFHFIPFHFISLHFISFHFVSFNFISLSHHKWLWQYNYEIKEDRKAAQRLL